MAHRTNVVQVMNKLAPAREETEEVSDPVCGAKLRRARARHVLFRSDGSYYFCSKECENEFIHPKAATRRLASSR